MSSHGVYTIEMQVEDPEYENDTVELSDKQVKILGEIASDSKFKKEDALLGVLYIAYRSAIEFKEEHQQGSRHAMTSTQEVMASMIEDYIRKPASFIEKIDHILPGVEWNDHPIHLDDNETENDRDIYEVLDEALTRAQISYKNQDDD